MNPLHSQIEAILAQLNRVILGKDSQIRLCLACLLARGHLLIEDIPGVGKTTLAHGIAQTLGLSFQRVQFTSDLIAKPASSVSSADRSLPSWFSPTKSIAPRPRRKARCWKRWKSTR